MEDQTGKLRTDSDTATGVELAAKNRKRKRRLRIFGGAAAIVVFVTTYMLILPAITLEHDTTCGLSEHTHTDACYEVTETLACGQEETPGHTHSDACYETQQSLVCGQEEGEDHTHSEACYQTLQTLICGQEEAPAHTHSDTCYVEEKTLICTLPEHTHSDDCYAKDEEDSTEEADEDEDEDLPTGDPEADLESAATWEATLAGVTLTGDWGADAVAIAQTQLGYCESTLNYISYRDENDEIVTKGYSRYGAWWGSPYGDWCAMFCSFCYSYAGIPQSAMPQHSGVPAWIALLSSRGQYHDAASGYVPKAGDLIFYDWEPDGTSDHVALVTGCDGGRVYTIEGNFNDMVAACSYSLSDYRIKGYGELPENPDLQPVNLDAAAAETDADEAQDPEPFVLQATADDGVVVLVSGTVDVLPCDPGEITLTAVRMTDAEAEQLAADAGLDGEDRTNVAYDITLWRGDEEIEPTGTVSVSFLGYEVADINSLQVVHFPEEGGQQNLTPELNEDGGLTLEMDGFSPTLLSASDETVTSSDLKDFVTGLVIKDLNGNEITAGGTVYLGQNYDFTLSFGETNESGNRSQFTADSSGYLTYEFESSQLELTEYSVEQPIKHGDTVIGYYTVTKTAEGKWLIKARFLNVDNDGNSISTPWYDYYANASFSLNFLAQVTTTTTSEDIEIDYSGEEPITVVVSKEGGLDVNKTASSYSQRGGYIIYTVTGSVTKGSVKGVTVVDTLQNTDGFLTLGDSITVKDSSGSTISADKYTCTISEDKRTLTVKFTDELSAGDGFTIQYRAYVDMADYRDSLDGQNTVTYTAENQVALSGKSNDGKTPTVTDSTTTNCNSTNMQKYGSAKQVRDSDGNLVSVMYWTINLGDYQTPYTGETLLDAFGDIDGTPYLSIYEAEPITLTYYDLNGNPNRLTVDWNDTTYVTKTDTGFKLKLPDGVHYAISYYTTVDQDAISAYNTAHPSSRISYVANHFALESNPEAYITGHGRVSDGIPGISKEVSGADSEYIYYTVEVQVPQSCYGNPLYLTDTLQAAGYNYTSYIEITDITVTTTDSGTTFSIPEYDGTGTQDTGWSSEIRSNQLYIFFNDTNSTWKVNEDSVMTVTYRVSKNGIGNSNTTIRYWLMQGQQVYNTITVTTNGGSMTDDVSYYEKESGFKWALPNSDDSMIAYCVGFNNQTNGTSSSGTITTSPLLPSDGSFSGGYLYDDYDETKVKLVQNTEYGITYYVKAEVFAAGTNLTNGNATVQASFACQSVSDSGGAFTASWSSFNMVTASGNAVVLTDATLEQYMQQNPTACIRFTYYMEPLTSAITQSGGEISVSNSAKLGWNVPDGGTSKPVEVGPYKENYSYTVDLIEKLAQQETTATGGDIVDFGIVINKDGLDLVEGGDTLTVTDTMSENLALDYSSITIYYLADSTTPTTDCPSGYTAATYKYDADTHTITFTIPDGIYVVIAYAARVTEEGEITFNNTAKISGIGWASSTTEQTITVTDTSGTGTGSRGYLTILKQDSNTKASLAGAQFALYGVNDSAKVKTAPSGIAQSITAGNQTLYYYGSFTTAEINGAFTINDNDYLTIGNLYALVETKAPDGYVLPSNNTTTFYWVKDANGSTTSTTIPIKQGGDTLVIENAPVSYDLPKTGGPGTTPFTWAGIGMMTAALGTAFSMRRRKERRRSS